MKLTEDNSIPAEKNSVPSIPDPTSTTTAPVPFKTSTSYHSFNIDGNLASSQVLSLDQGTLDDGFEVITYDQFDSMGLTTSLLRGIYSLGFEKPSPIQQKAIVPITQGKDVIAQSQSGTGKTGAFCIGMLSIVQEELKETQAIILSPTRELANQSYEIALSLGEYMSLSMHISIGGTSMKNEINALNRRPQIVIGTPGRILHMSQEGYLNLQKVKILILDEMDVLLDSGFKDTIYDIFHYLPNSVQVILVSATMPPEILDISKKFMRDPVRILLKKDSISLTGIRQFFVEVNEGYKMETILDLYDSISISQSVIFCNTIKRAQFLENKLREQKYSVSTVHSGMSQEERSQELDKFKRVVTRVLISTDILARGIDVQGVSVVVNFDLPKNKENYIHRIGRCGRYGRKGIAINFISEDEVKELREIERHYSTVVEELPHDFKKYLQ